MNKTERLMLGFALAGAALTPALLVALVKKNLLSAEEAVALVDDAINTLAPYHRTPSSGIAASAEEALQGARLLLMPPRSGRDR